LINDFAYCEAVETLMGVEITPRCRYLRTLLSEYSRIADHLTCIAASLMELGAMTAFLYLVMIRDYIYEHLADLTGARVTYSYGRIGGLARDLPDTWLPRLVGDPRQVRSLHRAHPRPDGSQPDLHRPHARRRRDLDG
jgi:NADH-quinone oxidoreductase subunit D